MAFSLLRLRWALRRGNTIGLPNHETFQTHQNPFLTNENIFDVSSYAENMCKLGQPQKSAIWSVRTSFLITPTMDYDSSFLNPNPDSVQVLAHALTLNLKLVQPQTSGNFHLAAF